jgi:prepilin-type N-terminal cleavage/methylation domain-containing protein
MKNSRGFTLMEVLFALAMVGTALGFSMYSTNLIGSTYSINRRLSKAHDVAGEVLEELLTIYDSDAKLTAGDHTQNYDDSGRKTAGAATFTATWTVRHNFPLTKVMEIQLRVEWNDNGHSRSVRYLTYRST